MRVSALMVIVEVTRKPARHRVDIVVEVVKDSKVLLEATNATGTHEWVFF